MDFGFFLNKHTDATTEPPPAGHTNLLLFRFICSVYWLLFLLPFCIYIFNIKYYDEVMSGGARRIGMNVWVLLLIDIHWIIIYVAEEFHLCAPFLLCI